MGRLESKFVRVKKMNYKVIDKETYYRKGVFRHFTEDCKSLYGRLQVLNLDNVENRRNRARHTFKEHRNEVLCQFPVYSFKGYEFT